VLHHWLDTHARHSVSAKTLDLYERIIRLHIVPSFGPIRVQKLTADQLQTFYSDRLAAGCGRRTVELCHLRISQALKQAVKLGLVARNVADAVTPPRIVPKEMQTRSPEQARRFLDAAQHSSYGPIWMLYLATGLRRGSCSLTATRTERSEPMRVRAWDFHGIFPLKRR
jgi:integrase